RYPQVRSPAGPGPPSRRARPRPWRPQRRRRPCRRRRRERRPGHCRSRGSSSAPRRQTGDAAGCPGCGDRSW
ncbi:Transcriptional regulator, y4mF family, partial [Dysosmobacter welbionis]